MDHRNHKKDFTGSILALFTLLFAKCNNRTNNGADPELDEKIKNLDRMIYSNY
jgi:hypothetical protein